jgi:hypothetical protein
MLLLLLLLLLLLCALVCGCDLHVYNHQLRGRLLSCSSCWRVVL